MIFFLFSIFFLKILMEFIKRPRGRPRKNTEEKINETEDVVKRPRGRPRKNTEEKINETEDVVKRPRGRPKKNIFDVSTYLPKRSLRIEKNRIMKEKEKIEKDIIENKIYNEKRERKSKRLQAMSRTEESCSVCLCGTIYITECGHFLCKKCYLELLKYNKILHNRNPPCPLCRQEIKEPL